LFIIYFYLLLSRKLLDYPIICTNVLICVIEKSGRKRPLGRPRRRWVDNIKIDHREIGWDGVDWIDLAQDRDQLGALVSTVMNLRVP
jgi:hypothetical protein